jgi:dihydrofolate reductase
MSKVRVAAFSISVDGFGAGPDQRLEQPMGAGGMALHEWVLGTRTFQAMHAEMTGGAAPAAPGRVDADDAMAARAMANLGAWILGRNMFGPVRGPWPDDAWKGWWGTTPPYHVPVFVLTHHPRASFEMAGGTTFHFVTGGIHEALAKAREAAGSRDVRIGGGPATVRQYLEAGLVDEVHLAISPVLLGRGEPLLAGLDLPRLGLRCTEHVATERALHVIMSR